MFTTAKKIINDCSAVIDESVTEEDFLQWDQLQDVCRESFEKCCLISFEKCCLCCSHNFFCMIRWFV